MGGLYERILDAMTAGRFFVPFERRELDVSTAARIRRKLGDAVTCRLDQPSPMYVVKPYARLLASIEAALCERWCDDKVYLPRAVRGPAVRRMLEHVLGSQWEFKIERNCLWAYRKGAEEAAGGVPASDGKGEGPVPGGVGGGEGERGPGLGV